MARNPYGNNMTSCLFKNWWNNVGTSDTADSPGYESGKRICEVIHGRTASGRLKTTTEDKDKEEPTTTQTVVKYALITVAVVAVGYGVWWLYKKYA